MLYLDLCKIYGDSYLPFMITLLNVMDINNLAI